MRPVVFVGSSTEGLDVANSVQAALRQDADVTVWTQGVFGVSKGVFEALLGAARSAKSFDFAVLVLTPDDLVTTRGDENAVPRDNVLFELGLFMGALGPERTFIFRKRHEGLHLPSDLAAVIAAEYDEREDGNLDAAVGAACHEIRNAIKALGPNPSRVLWHDTLSTVFRSILANVHATDSIRHDPFRNEMARQLEAVKKTTRDWSSGRITALDNYTEVLKGVYRNAKEHVFATCIPDYIEAWNQPWGEELLRTQRQNRAAKSTRVFIFNTQDDVETQHEETFQLHTDFGVEVLLYFDSEDDSFRFRPELGHDWTVVDNGEVVGVTSRFGKQYEATWHFNDTSLGTRLREDAESLRQASVLWTPGWNTD